MTPVRTIRRIVGYALSILLFGIGFGWILIDDQRQSWADKLANTVVIYNWDARLYDGVWLGQERDKPIQPRPMQTLVQEPSLSTIEQDELSA